MSVEPKVLDHVRKILEKFSNRYFTIDGTLKRNSVIEDLENYDTDLMKSILEDNLLYKTYTKKIAGVVIFEISNFIDMLRYKEYWEDSFTKYNNKIGLSVGNRFISDTSDVVLNFPYKDCILKAGMTKEDVENSKDVAEPFLNEILAKPEIDELFEPKIFANVTKYDNNGNKTKASFISNKENIIIKGNNLIVLHTLKKRYEADIDVIYIDPPYNVPSSNNTFVYNNNFNQSSWLAFMKNRLEISKQLLRPSDGALIIAIDENEVNYLGVMLDEMFPEYEKHLITVIHNPRGIQGTNFSYNNEFLYFVFPKNKKIIGNRKLNEDEITFSNLRNWGGESLRSDGKNTFFPILVDKKTMKIKGFGDVCKDSYHPKQTELLNNSYYVYPIDKNGIERKWRYARQTIDSIKHQLKAKINTNGRIEILLGKDFGQYKTVWESNLYDSSVHGKQLLEKTVPNSGFSFPKSVYAVKDALYAVVGNRKNAKILDFFSGSGTTGDAVQMLNKEDGGNRNFILVEQMDYAKTVDVERMNAKSERKRNDGFIYAELMEKSQGYINDLRKAVNVDDVMAVYNRMKQNSDIDFRVDLDKFEESLKKGELSSLQKCKKEIIRIIDKNQLYYNFDNIDDVDVRDLVSDSDYQFNKSFYFSKQDGKE